MTLVATGFELYETAMEPARWAFRNDGVVPAVLSCSDPAVLHRFLIGYCADGVTITRPVPSWLHRAGLAIMNVGLTDLGAALAEHASEEEGHENLMIADVHALCRLWNERYDETLDADSLLSSPPSAAAIRYCEMHEQLIGSTEPFRQIALQYEIEQLSRTVAPTIMAHLAAVCGAEVVAGLSFLRSHISLDEGHVAFDVEQISSLLAARPECIDALVDSGTEALDCYRSLLGELLDTATAAP